MIYWLLIIILAYLLFGLASLCDKLILAGKPRPNSYTFYVGAASLFSVVLIPFANFSVPDVSTFIWIILTALVHILGLYWLYTALENFDVSKVIATIGATQPLFILALAFIFWQGQLMQATDIVAFILLLVGGVIISIEKTAKNTGNYLKATLFSSLMFSLDYIFAKEVFLRQEFLNGIIWIAVFIFIFAMFLLIKKKSRKEIFEKQVISNKKTNITFILAQIFGGGGGFLQMFAVSLAPVTFLATVSSLRGVQYVFLFLITLGLSIFYPKVLQEKFSVKLILQKAISILLIAIGLAILAF